MRKLFFILVFIFCCNLSFSQTATSKYNSILQRYEYFDSNGDLTGYKVYNNIRGQWEYYAETPRRLNENKYGEVKSPIDVDLMGSVLMSKQNKYNSNKQLVNNALRDIYDKIFSSGLSEEIKLKMYDAYVKANNDVKKLNVDYSSSVTTNSVISYFYECYNNQLDFYTK